MRRLASIVFGLFTCLVSIFPNSLLASNLGLPSGFVNDFTGTLTTEQISNLESKLSQFEKTTTNEISVVIIRSLDGDSIENFAEKLFQEWGIGKAKIDNGALLLVSLEDRRMRIEVGYGLEGSLTDLLSSRIINETLTPSFRAGDFFGGIDSATDQIIKIVSGGVAENLIFPTENIVEHQPSGGVDWFFWIMLFISTVPMTLASILGVSKSWWAGGVLGGIVGVIFGFIWGFIYVGVGSVVILTLIGLIFDFLVSKSYAKSKSETGKPPWWLSGGGGSSFRSGGGGGSSFSGFGGGRSGGGGASGSW